MKRLRNLKNVKEEVEMSEECTQTSDISEVTFYIPEGMNFAEYKLFEAAVDLDDDIEGDYEVRKPSATSKPRPVQSRSYVSQSTPAPRQREMTRDEMESTNKIINNLMKQLGLNITVILTYHTRDDRMTHQRNDIPVSASEIYNLFLGVFKKYGKLIEQSIPKVEDENQAFQFIMTDTKTNLNMVMAGNWRRSIQSNALRVKTVMRKKGFVPNNPNEKHFKI
jgi:hypothetical protein